MLAYRDSGNNESPVMKNEKPDHFVGKFYVLFAQKSKENDTYEQQAQEMLEQWEKNDAATVSLWKKMNAWALAGFRETFQLFGVEFEKEFYESDIYKHGKEIIMEGLSRGVFKLRDDGAVIADLTGQSLGEKVLLRSNGTSVYIVQDIHLAYLKNDLYHPQRSIYVVGNEQEYHFNVLKAILSLLDANYTDNGIHHLSYGMVELPDGRMKSREGSVVDADDLIKETAKIAEKEIKKRYHLPEKKVKQRALCIALAAIKYQLLKTETSKNMMFNPKEAIRFEGDTGPYLLYSYARASSILRKAESEVSTEAWDINGFEARLLKKLASFPEIISSSSQRLIPSLLATYAFELCQVFNHFFHECPVLKSDVIAQRLALVQAFRKIIGNCLDLMGIEKIEEM
jgi:arginyl-tRNA synthetase